MKDGRKGGFRKKKRICSEIYKLLARNFKFTEFTGVFP